MKRLSSLILAAVFVLSPSVFEASSECTCFDQDLFCILYKDSGDMAGWFYLPNHPWCGGSGNY